MKTVVFRQYDSHGDWMNINGLIRFTLEKKEYEKAYLVLEVGDVRRTHCELMYADDSKISVINYSQYCELCASGTSFDVVDTRHPGEAGVQSPLHNGETYSYCNPLFNSENVTIDHAENTRYYTHHNINKEVKLNYFYFERKSDLEEKFYKEMIIEKSYSIICDYGENLIHRKYIKNDRIINLHNISPIFFDILKVIEECDDIHFIENSLALFVYHMQYKNLMKKNKICLHTYARKELDRQCNGPGCNNKFLNMISSPPLENWEFIY
jgi:hypothetical protein